MTYVWLFICKTSIFSQQTDYTVYVNPFVGTAGHGHTYPGAVVPFGMVQLSPDTRLSGWDGCSGYHYSDNVIYGFTHTHFSGTGCLDLGDILFMPVAGAPSPKKKDYSSTFSHENEYASPGYYAVKLDKGNIQVELTATTRVGFHKYTFSKGDKSYIILDLKHRDKVLESTVRITGENTIEGMRRSKAWAEDQHIYFAAEFSKPFTEYGIYKNNKLKKKINELNADNIKAYFCFNTEVNKTIYLKVGISTVSIEGARKNLAAELNGWDFEKVKKDAHDTWQKELSKIEAGSSRPDVLKTFYTALYHTMVVPNVNMDVDGAYRGMDNKIHHAQGFIYYNVFSLWDTFRAAHPLYTIIQGQRTTDFLKTFIAMYKDGGRLPMWEFSCNETDCMIGYHSIPVIVDAFVKGYTDFDIKTALEAMKKSATENKYGIQRYIEQGYLGIGEQSDCVSKTLEYAYDDWCIAIMAQMTGDENTYREYMKRAGNYKNLYDYTTGFFRPKVNRHWLEPFNPFDVNRGAYCEANAWQYNFFVPQDINGLIDLSGGKEAFTNKLDELFTVESKLTGTAQSDISGMIGQYAHGNEPSHNYAYLFNFAGKAWKTQRMVRRIMEELYNPNPDGLCGNEDCGQMSAWYVLSALGFYPVTPGMTYYVIGSPILDKAVIHTENGRSFSIEASNNNKENVFIKNVLMDGSTYAKSWINHGAIMNGGTLKFEMSPQPNESWGAVEMPVSNLVR